MKRETSWEFTLSQSSRSCGCQLLVIPVAEMDLSLAEDEGEKGGLWPND
jgi:hypothetical protein